MGLFHYLHPRNLAARHEFEELANIHGQGPVRADVIDMLIEEMLRITSPTRIVSRVNRSACPVQLNAPKPTRRRRKGRTQLLSGSEEDANEPAKMAQPGHSIGLDLFLANRDPERFENPDDFQPLRRKRNPHLAFGFGQHICVGREMARQQARVAIPILLRAFPKLQLREGKDAKIVEIPNFTFRMVDWDAGIICHV